MPIIVEKIGYLSLADVQKLINNNERFGIYKTAKGTEILVKFPVWQIVSKAVWLYYPKRDRLPYKVVEGRKITYGNIVFNSTIDKEISTTNWNNGNQIMAYEPYDL